MTPSSLPAVRLPLLPGQLPGVATRPVFSSHSVAVSPTARKATASDDNPCSLDAVANNTPPSRIPVVQREGRLLTERRAAGLGGFGLVMPFKHVVSRTISALHHSLDVLRHAAAKLCAAPGECAGDRQKSGDGGKRDHVMRSNVTRPVRQIFFASGPKSLGRQFGRREQTKIFVGGDEYERF